MNWFKKVSENIFASNVRIKSALLAILIFAICSCNSADRIKVKDQFTPLPDNSVQMNGYLEDYIQNSILHWNKGSYHTLHLWRNSGQEGLFSPRARCGEKRSGRDACFTGTRRILN